MIYIIGLGPNDELGIKENIKKLLIDNKNKIIIARTKEHPAVNFLIENDINFETCDRFYIENNTFKDTYEQIAEYILTKAKKNDVFYLVPGHPMVAELTTKLLINSPIKTTIIGGTSFLDSCFNSAKFDPVEGFELLDATNLELLRSADSSKHILITQCYDDLTAANISLELEDFYPYDYEVTIMENLEGENEKIYKSPLNELSSAVGENINNLRTIYIPAYSNGVSFNIKSYIPNFDEAKEENILLADLLKQTTDLSNYIKQNDVEKIEFYLAKILKTTLSFANASDAYYDINNILKNLNKE